MDTTGSLAEMMAGNTVSIDFAADRLVDLIRKTTREKEGGEFIAPDGTTLPW